MSIGSRIDGMILARGMLKSFVSSYLGITTKSLANKLNGKTEFTASEIQKLGLLFRLTAEELGRIFL